MAELGKYCKAYELARLRAFPGWAEQAKNSQLEMIQVGGKAIKRSRALTDQSIVYLQENYVLTDGIYKDKNILFDNFTLEWIDYCLRDLV